MTDYEKARDAAAEEYTNPYGRMPPLPPISVQAGFKAGADWANQRAEADGHSPQFWKRSYDAANQRAETLEKEIAELKESLNSSYEKREKLTDDFYQEKKKLRTELEIARQERRCGCGCYV